MPETQDIQILLPDGYIAFARYLSPPQPRGDEAASNPLRGAVLYHPGIQSHTGWFETSAMHLVEAGYALLIVDRRGVGQNTLDRGHAESADQLIGDAMAGRDELLRRSGLQTYHVVGVSWGGKLAVAAFVTDPVGVQSLSLATPGLFPLVGATQAEMTTIAFAMLYEPLRSFDIPLNEPQRLTSCAHWQEFLRNDPHALHQCTAGFYLASRRMDKIVNRLNHSEAVPLCLFVAGDERIIDSEKTVKFVTDLDWPNTKITRYESARHTLEFEACKEEYFTDLVAFIDSV